MGHLARMYGLAIDNLIRVKMVLASGEVKIIDENTPELFWGIKGIVDLTLGAGANFGVVLEFTFKTHKVPPKITLGTFVYLPIPLLAGSIFEHPKVALKKSVTFSQREMTNETSNIIVIACGGNLLIIKRSCD